MNSNVVDLDMVRAARAIAEETEAKLGSELKRAKAQGFKLTYRLESEEQIGRGTLHIARVRLTPETNNARVRLTRAANEKIAGATAIEARAEYIDPPDVFDALKAAVDEAFELATDAGVFK